MCEVNILCICVMWNELDNLNMPNTEQSCSQRKELLRAASVTLGKLD